MKYDVWTDSADSNLRQWEGLGDVLGKAVQGLADWLGLGSTVVSKWVSQGKSSTIANLRSTISKKLAEGEYTIEQMQNKLDQLGLGGYNLTGNAAEAYGKYKKQVQSDLDKAKKNWNTAKIEYSKMEGDLDRAEAASKDLGPSYQRMAKEIISNVERTVGGSTNA